MGFKVTAPLVAIAPSDKSGDLDDANEGPRYFYEGAVIQDGFNDERCKELVDEGMLEKVTVSKDGDVSEPAESDGPPAKSASKGDWEAYARSQGATDEDLDGATKDDLVAKYGD